MALSRLLSILSFRFPTSNPKSKSISCSIPDCNICKNMLVATGDKNWQEHSKDLPMPNLFPTRSLLPASRPNLNPITNPAGIHPSSPAHSQPPKTKPTPNPELRPSSSVYSRPTIALTSIADADSKLHPPPRARWILAFDTTLVILSLTILSLSSAYAQQLLHAPRASVHPSNHGRSTHDTAINPTLYPPPHPSSYDRTWVLLYSLSMPLLSLLACLVSLALWWARRSTAALAAVHAISFLAGWMVNVGWWVECDWASGTYNLYKDYGSECCPCKCSPRLGTFG